MARKEVKKTTTQSPTAQILERFKITKSPTALTSVIKVCLKTLANSNLPLSEIKLALEDVENCFAFYKRLVYKGLEEIPGFPNYWIAKDGRVWFYGRLVNMYDNGTGKYFKIDPTSNPEVKYLGLDKALALAYLENDDPEHKTYVWHLDGNFQNCDLENLLWVTLEEGQKINEVRRARKEVKSMLDPKTGLPKDF